jgi:hypothetical protein
MHQCHCEIPPEPIKDVSVASLSNNHPTMSPPLNPSSNPSPNIPSSKSLPDPPSLPIPASNPNAAPLHPLEQFSTPVGVVAKNPSLIHGTVALHAEVSTAEQRYRKSLVVAMSYRDRLIIARGRLERVAGFEQARSSSSSTFNSGLRRPTRQSGSSIFIPLPSYSHHHPNLGKPKMILFTQNSVHPFI